VDSLQQEHASALLSGDEAGAVAAFDAGVKLGTGYPGTPSTEILETSAADCHPASVPDYTPVPELRELQLQRLQAVIARAWQQVMLFQSRLVERGLKPEDIRSLEEIAKLPFTEKSDLRDTYPFGLFASPMKDVVRLHVSSGTTGKPIVVAYTKEDVEVWTSVMVRCLAGCGLHRGDIIQNAYGYGLFTGGLGTHYGAEALGATVVPTSGGNADRQIMLMKDFGMTAICCTPTYFLHLIERAAELGVDMKKLPLRAGIFGAEPWTESMRKHIEEASSIEAFDIYGLSEIIGPGVGCECRRHDGLHIIEDHFYPEIVDPDTGKTLPDGVEGELVFTTLTKQAMPIIRYRTRDITTILPGQCACGRTLRRIRRIGRRSDDMLILRGVNVFPSQIEAALLEIEGTLPHYQIILTREQGLDQMEVQVEVTPQMFNDKVVALKGLHRKLQATLDHVLGIRVHVSLVEMRSLERSEGKAKRVIDRRTQ
jgi:phenylacetate-CoA ligase